MSPLLIGQLVLNYSKRAISRQKEEFSQLLFILVFANKCGAQEVLDSRKRKVHLCVIYVILDSRERKVHLSVIYVSLMSHVPLLIFIMLLS